MRILQSFKLREGATRVTGARMKDGLVGRLLMFVDFLFYKEMRVETYGKVPKLSLAKGSKGVFTY